MIQLSTATRNGRADAFETAAGASPILEIIEGPPPANCAAADPGLVLATMNLPPDWMDPASGGVKTKSGTWQDLLGDANGTAGHFRIWDATHTTCHMQGTVGMLGDGADMTVDNSSIAVDQTVTVTGFTLSEPNG